MLKLYITESIYLLKNKMYSNDKLIKKETWHKELSKIGWNKLPVQWIKLLNKVSENPPKNSLYGCLDCGSDGNCFFHCISESLNSQSIHTRDCIHYTSDTLREKLSNFITRRKFNDIIQLYRIMKDTNDFEESWDPYSVQTLEQFRQIIKDNDDYWCDNILLSEMISMLHLNIVILLSDSIQKKYSYYNICQEYNPYYQTVILLYEDSNHFLLVGKFIEHKMIVIFDDTTLPDEIKHYII